MLTKRQREVLERMVAGEELAVGFPGGWYIGDQRLGGQVGWFLLRWMFVRIENDYINNEDLWRLEITAEGRAALEDNDE